LQIENLASTASTDGDRNTPSFNVLLQGFRKWSKNGAKRKTTDSLKAIVAVAAKSKAQTSPQPDWFPFELKNSLPHSAVPKRES
jgi:hypothetical protein